MSTDDTFIKQQWQDQEALHRFQLTSPLLQTDLDDARRLRLRRTAGRSLMRITFLSALFTGTKKPLQKNSSQVSDLLTVKSTVLRSFRKTLNFFWNRRSSFAGKCRNGQLQRSFTFWKQKVLWHRAF